MQEVDKHISELLYTHDCVILPDFGGFVANYAPAKINPLKHTFTSPSKNIIFNKNLKNNDGLLANHIANTDHINYPEACKRLDHFVDNVNSKLKQGAKVKMDEVGTLFLDAERNIQFEAATTNFLLDAFGLTSFQSPAINRGNIGKRIEKELKNRSAIPLDKKKIDVKKYVALAIALPVLFAMIWVPLKTDLLKNVNYSNLNPFASKEINKTEIKIDSKKTTGISSLVKTDTTPVKSHVSITPSQPVTASLVEPVKADSTEVVKVNNVNPGYKFHLVVGCFQIKKNAIKFVNTLQQKNMDAVIIGQNDKGLYVVSSGDFATRKQALMKLSSLRKLQPAWLYKN